MSGGVRCRLSRLLVGLFLFIIMYTPVSQAHTQSARYPSISGRTGSSGLQRLWASLRMTGIVTTESAVETRIEPAMMGLSKG